MAKCQLENRNRQLVFVSSFFFVHCFCVNKLISNQHTDKSPKLWWNVIISMFDFVRVVCTVPINRLCVEVTLTKQHQRNNINPFESWIATEWYNECSVVVYRCWFFVVFVLLVVVEWLSGVVVVDVLTEICFSNSYEEARAKQKKNTWRTILTTRGGYSYVYIRKSGGTQFEGFN